MVSSWWGMPGPSRYVDSILDELRSGRCVIVALPEHVPDGLDLSLRRRVSEDATWAWHTIHVDNFEYDEPIDVLHSLFLPDVSPGDAHSVANLAQDEAFGCRVIRLDGFTSDTWPKWKSFLSNYVECLRNIPLLNRALFITMLTGTCALDLPDQEICLACHVWRNRTGFLDLQLYASHLVDEWAVSELEKKVYASVIASLAEWDPNVAQMLGGVGPECLSDPMPVLSRMAQDRRWLRRKSTQDASWHQGMLNTVDGVEKMHSALLAAVSDTTGVVRRVWRGQVGVLLPFVDERRIELITALKDSLVIPFPTRFRNEFVTDPYDLEIGHLHHQMNTVIRVPHDIHSLVDCLHHIRTELSHLRPVDHLRLRQEELLRWREIVSSAQAA